MRSIPIGCVAFVVAIAEIARAQSGLYDAVLLDGTRIASQGDPAPGGGAYTLFNHVQAGGNGDVAFTAGVSGGSAAEGLFRVAGGVHSALALSGQAAPSVSGTYLVFNAVGVNDVGAVAFRSRIQHMLLPETTALFVNEGGVTTLLVEQGQPAPGTPGFEYLIPGPPAINDGGSVAFTSTLDSGDEAVFLASGGSPALVASSGDATPIGGTYTSFGSLDLDDADSVWFRADVAGGSAVSGIFVSEAGVESAVVAQGDATPAGGTFASFGAISVDESGQVAFQAVVTGGSAASGIFLRAPAGGITALALQGGVAPDTGGGSFGSLGSLELAAPSLNDGGDAAFGANLFGGTASSGIFGVPAGGSLEAVAVRDGSLPSEPLQLYKAFSPVVLDDSGAAAFRAQLFSNADDDADGYLALDDNCLLISNPTQCDTDLDGWGNHCDGDFDQSGLVTAPDFTNRFLPDFKKGADVAPFDGTDMDCSGSLNANDFSVWFAPQFKQAKPGPSGLDCAGTVPCQADL